MIYDLRLFLALSALCLLTSVLSSAAADRITATITITDTAVVDDTFIINGVTRTWKDSIVTPATQIITGTDEFESTTNLIAQLLSYPATGVTVYQLGDDSFRLDGITGLVLTIGGAGDYFSVSYSTQSVTAAYTVIVPPTSVPSVRRQTMTEGIVDWLNLTSAKAIFENSTSVSNLVGLTNAQTIAGIKMFTNAAGQWRGLVSNSPAISGNFNAVSNGVWWSGFLTGGTSTNHEFYGESIFRGQADFNAGIGFNGFASMLDAADEYFSMTPETGGHPTYFGNYGEANGVSAHEGHFTNTVTAGTGSFTNLSMQGPSTLVSTNTFPAGADISFGRYAVTSLANGNNAGVPVGTNVFVEVSGPSGAFAINGINGQPNRDGKLLILVNQTGQDMTIAHQSGVDATAANRIINLTGSDRATTGNGAATLIYSGAASRWILVAFDP